MGSSLKITAGLLRYMNLQLSGWRVKMMGCFQSDWVDGLKQRWKYNRFSII